MIKLYLDKTINKIVLETDNPGVKSKFLEVVSEEVKYIPWKKTWGTDKKLIKIYDSKKTKNGITSFTFGLGWTAYLCNVFSGDIPAQDYQDLIKNAILSESPRIHPFQELRDYQNEDVLHLLKYRVGLFNVYTSYGKPI